MIYLLKKLIYITLKILDFVKLVIENFYTITLNMSQYYILKYIISTPYSVNFKLKNIKKAYNSICKYEY